MLYTRKGDAGTTTLCQPAGKRKSKSLPVFEALGSVDELNAWIGLVKTKVSSVGERDDGGLTAISKRRAEDLFMVLETVQQNLFIIQAEIAGAGKTVAAAKVKKMEESIDRLEQGLPRRHKFFLAGGTELSALLDVARTLARRAERHVLVAAEQGQVEAGKSTRAYLNRLSSLLYVCERLVNSEARVAEKSPTYE